MPASGWLISWAIEAVSSPNVDSRAAWVSSAWAISQRLFGAFAFGDVDRDPGKEGRAPRNRHQKCVDLRPEYVAILAPVALLAVLNVGLTGHLRCDDRLGGGQVVLMGDVEGREATEFCLGIAGHSLKGRVRRDIPSVRADQVDADGDAFEQFPPALLAHDQLAIEAGIFQRDRGLRRQQLQQRYPGGREHMRGQVVLEIEHAEQLGLFHQGQAQNRTGALLTDVVIRRERALNSGVIQDDALPHPDHGVEKGFGEQGRRHGLLSDG